MNISKLFCGFVPLLKQNPLAGAMLSGLGSLGSSLFSQEAQQRENEEVREWQEKMWNKTNEYNSPANQKKLLQEAGYNPYLYGDDYNGSGASLPSAPSNQPLPRLDNPVQGASQFFQQGLQVESNVELQHAKALETVTDTLIKAYQEGGQKLYDKVYDGIKPVIDRINWIGSRSEIEFNERMKLIRSERYNKDMDSLNKDLQYSLGKKYSEQQIQAGLEQIQYNISEIVGRLNTMNVQNQALIKRVASEIVVNAANAFKLQKEGDKYSADAATVNAIRDSVITIIKGEASVKSLQGSNADAELESNEVLYGAMTSKENKRRKAKEYDITMEQRSSDLLRATDKAFGEYFNVGFSYGHNENKSESINYLFKY